MTSYLILHIHKYLYHKFPEVQAVSQMVWALYFHMFPQIKPLYFSKRRAWQCLSPPNPEIVCRQTSDVFQSERWKWQLNVIFI